MDCPSSWPGRFSKAKVRTIWTGVGTRQQPAAFQHCRGRGGNCQGNGGALTGSNRGEQHRRHPEVHADAGRQLHGCEVPPRD